jgi:hypothetical protein
VKKPIKSGRQIKKAKYSLSSYESEDKEYSKSTKSVLSSLKDSKKELNRVFESLTGETVLEEEDMEELEDIHDKVKSKFADISAQIREGSVLNPELITRTLYIELLTTTIDLIPLAEKAYRASKRESAAYAYTNMIDKAQQLAADIRVLKDTSGQAEYIKDSIIKPVFLALTSTILQEILIIKSAIDSELLDSPKKGIRLKAKCDDAARSVADYMNKSLFSAHEQTHAFLSGSLINNQKLRKK